MSRGSVVHAGRALFLLALVAAARPAVAQQPEAADSAAPEGSNDIFVNGFEFNGYCFWTEVHGGDSICVVSIPIVQSESIRGRVRVEGVYITGLTADRKHFWVSEALPAWYYEGVYIDRGVGATALGSEFQVGAVVDVEGDIVEFDSAPPGNTLTEIATSIEPVLVGPAGAGPTPYLGAGVPILEALDNGEQFEGVLVNVTDVAVSDIATGDLLTLRDNNVDTITMDDIAFDYSSASFPLETCFASVTGLMHLDVVENVRRILPRSASDIVLGSNCLHP